MQTAAMFRCVLESLSMVAGVKVAASGRRLWIFDICFKDFRTLPRVSLQLRTHEPCYMFPRSSGPLNLATCPKAVQDCRTLLYELQRGSGLEPCYMFRCSSGPLKLATWFSAVLASELCYKFQCGPRLANLVIWSCCYDFGTLH